MDNELHDRALKLAETYKRTESQLIGALQEIDKHKVYLRLAYSSLFDYCVRALGLSESTSYNFISVSRKAVQIPQLKQAIESGTLSISKAKKIVAVMTPQNQKDWIRKAETLSSRELEREVVKVSPKESVEERAKYIQYDRVSLQFGISHGLFEKLKRVQDLESRRTSNAASLEQVIEAMVSLYLEKKDPMARAQRIQRKTRPSGQSSQLAQKIESELVADGTARLVTGTVVKAGASERRRFIPSQTKHQVYLRDRGNAVAKIAGTDDGSKFTI